MFVTPSGLSQRIPGLFLEKIFILSNNMVSFMASRDQDVRNWVYDEVDQMLKDASRKIMTIILEYYEKLSLMSTLLQKLTMMS